jgi:signal transduction histidine kinase/ActR/RegA family two-component response regulator
VHQISVVAATANCGDAHALTLKNIEPSTDERGRRGALFGLAAGRGFKLEAAVFLALIVTFAAVLWGDSLRQKHLSLTESGAHFLPYIYSDRDEGGATWGQLDPENGFGWNCDLRPKVQYPYCGYGLQVDGSEQWGKTLDLSRYDRITVSLVYHGAPTRLKVVLKNFDPAYSSSVTGQTTMPNVAEFPVSEGLNTIHLRLDGFGVDQWWLDQNKLPEGQRAPDLRNVVALDFVTAGGPKTGKFTAAVQSVKFSGIWLTSAQWYLLILGMWLVVAGLFLVYRFIAVKTGLEARQRLQERESRELALARAAAEAASDAKSQFLANMSHELRTPLNAVLGYAQLLKRGELGDRQKSAVSAILQSGNHLLMLITDILDLSKIEAGRLDLMPGPFDLHACVEQVGTMIRLRAEEKGIDFAIGLEEGLPGTVIGDAKRVRQILLNLLGNAVKFTATGEVRMDVSSCSRADGTVRLRFEVSDTGKGIAESEVERLFEPFEQVGTVTERSGGTGLGLSIARQLVRAMGGEIKVQSCLGQGSRFSAEIECALTSSAVLDGQLERPALTNGIRVLAVDDDSATREFLSAALTKLGALPSTAESGASALEACSRDRPDVVLIDLKMPGMNGLATIRQMKMSSNLRDVPVVAISGSATSTSEADALAAGAVRLLEKPIDLEALAECLTGTEPETSTPGAGHDDATRPFARPPADRMEQLLMLARAGNMSGVRRAAEALAELDPTLRPFARRLCALAVAYQSPAVLRLVEQSMYGSEAA